MRLGLTSAAGLLGAALLLGPPGALALDLSQPEIKKFIAEVVQRDHLKRAWVAKVLGAAEIKPSIVEAMSKPAEHVRPWFEYRRVFITERRIHDGREFMSAHRAELEAAAADTGVPAAIIAAIVGVETSYGRILGSYRVVDALATLSFAYPPRAAYFRGELEQYLLLVREAKFDPLKAIGSYAGAMGACQFMPRSYREFAVDGNHDGRIDLWNSWPDIIASVAHYFVVHGWRPGQPIAASAELWYPDIEDLPSGRIELTSRVDALRAKGLLFESTLPADAPAVFIALRDVDRPAYRIGFHNFWVITRYNHSSMYALAVAELAAAIAVPDEHDAPAAGKPAAPVPVRSLDPDAELPHHGAASAHGGAP